MDKFVKILVFVLAMSIAASASFLDRVCKLPLNTGNPCVLLNITITSNSTSNSSDSSDNSTENEMYYFNQEKEMCSSFNYLGCEGNDNKFSESDDCIDSCQTPWLLKKEKDGGDTDANIEKHREKSDCQLKPDGGPCRALITMFYFDPSSGNCTGFGYGGCKGNRNRFDTQGQCTDFCSSNLKKGNETNKL